jgi:3-oxoacyl-[acyl-carrier-protein] synthase-3
MERYLGTIRGRASRGRARVLAQNGIQTRHYALDTEGRTTHRNCEMAAEAVRRAVASAGWGLEEVDFLAAASTQGDVLLPGFASLVHHALGTRSLELASLHGVCASGLQALRAAEQQVKSGRARRAVACASELASRLLKAGHYEELSEPQALGFETEFLRWMLSDGAGALTVEPAPRVGGLSLAVEWVDVRSHAGRFGIGMVAGAHRAGAGVGPSWLDYPTCRDAAADGAFTLQQDVRRLDRLVTLGVDGFFALVDSGRVVPEAIDWMLVHHSSAHFRKPITEALARGGVAIPEARWFSNLTTRGNTGSASLYLMLEELWTSGRLQPGQTVLCMVPESGGFITSFALLRAVGESPARAAVAPSRPEAPPDFHLGGPGGRLWRALTRVWTDFEERLAAVPVVAKLERGAFTRDDYRLLLVNLRQQVVEGSRWIARAASSMTSEHLELRSSFVRHAVDEHRDYEMLERHYVAMGGQLPEIRGAPANVGSQALSAWMMHRATQENPFDLLGAMFIIEGLGNRLARRWGRLIQEQLSLSDEDVRFFLYHGEQDGTHLGRLEAALASPVLTDSLADRIVSTAKVTARLYALQLEELGHV